MTMHVKRFIDVDKQPFEGAFSPFNINRADGLNRGVPELRSQYEVTTEFYNNTAFDFCVKDRLNIPLVFTQSNRTADLVNTRKYPDGLIIVKNYRCDPRVFDTIRQIAHSSAHEHSDMVMYYRHAVKTGLNPGHFNSYSRDIAFSITYVINPDYFHGNSDTVYIPDLDLVVACFKQTYQDVNVMIKSTADHPKYGQVLVMSHDTAHGYSRRVHLVDNSNTVRSIFIREGENIIKVDAENNSDFAENCVDGVYIITKCDGRQKTIMLSVSDLLTEEGQQKLAVLGIFTDGQKARTAAEHQYKAELLKKETAIIKAETEARQAKMEMDQLNRKIEQMAEEAIRENQRKKNEEEKHAIEMEKIRMEHANQINILLASQDKLKQEKELNEQKAQNTKTEYIQRSNLSDKQHHHDMSTIQRKETSETRKHKSDTWKYVVGIAASVVAVGVSVWKWFSGR